MWQASVIFINISEINFHFSQTSLNSRNEQCKLLIVISLHLINWTCFYKLTGKGKGLEIRHPFMFNLKICSISYSHYSSFWWSLFSKCDFFDSQASYSLFLQAKISIFTASFRKLEFLSPPILSRDFLKGLMTWQKCISCENWQEFVLVETVRSRKASITNILLFIIKYDSH